MVEGDGHLYDAEAIAKRTEGLARPEKWGQLPVAVYMQFDGEADHAFLSRWRCQGWVAAEFRAHVKQDLDCCSFRKNSVPVQLLHFRSSNCTTIRQGTYEEFSCPLKQWGCRVLYRVVRIYPGKDNLQFVAVYRTSNGAHTHFDSYEKSVHAGVTIDGRTKAHIRTLLSLRMSRPLDIARGLLTLGVPPKFVPSTRRIARYTQNHRDVLGNGLRNCLAGLVAEYKEHHYYSESVLGGNTSAHTGYVIPGADIGLWTTTNFSLLYTSDSLCRIAVENLKLKHGGWLGIDGKHRTNYCGFPLVPLVVTDSARRHFVVAICLMSDEFKWRVARAVRQFTLWLQTRFPLRVEDLPTVDLGDDEPEDDDASGDGTESLLSSGTLPAGLAGLTVVVAKKPRECKMCGATTGMASPFTERADGDAHSGFWPWLHYKRSGEETKVASGKVCSVCYAVFFMTSLKTVWSKSIGKYLKWKNSQDAIKRHQPFMQARKKYISLCNNFPHKHRLHDKCPFHVLDMCAVESEQ